MQLENYKAEAPLPDTVGAAVSGVRIALILMGATIALPAFVMGASLNGAMGLEGRSSRASSEALSSRVSPRRRRSSARTHASAATS
jgi:hypothetical protein